MIESIMAAFVVGSFLFWVCVVALVVATIICIETESVGWATIFTTVFLLLFGKELFGGISIKGLTLGFAAYFLAGGIWSVIKWYLYVKNKVSEVKSETDKKYLKSDLQPSRNKARIYSWISFWPASILWTVAHDTVQTVFDFLKGIYQRIVDSAFDGVKLKEKE